MVTEGSGARRGEEQRLMDELSSTFGRWKQEELDTILIAVVNNVIQGDIGVGSITPQHMLNRAALVDMAEPREKHHDSLNFLLSGAVHMGCPNAITPLGTTVISAEHPERTVIHPMHENEDEVVRVTAVVELAMEGRIREKFTKKDALEQDKLEEAIAREMGRVTTHPRIDRMTPSQLLDRAPNLGLDAAACERLTAEAGLVKRVHDAFQPGHRHDQDTLNGIYAAAAEADLGEMAVRRLVATAMDEKYSPQGRVPIMGSGKGTAHTTVAQGEPATAVVAERVDGTATQAQPAAQVRELPGHRSGGAVIS